jgi:thiol-disulfide isomerase/thioredoxin
MFLFIIFTVAGYYAYNKFYGYSPTDPVTDIANANKPSGDGDVATIYFFNVSWCPHCKTALPEWDKFSKTNDNSTVNGYVIKCVNKDCTNTDDPKIKVFIDTYSIEHYPTIKMMKSGKIYSFEGKISEVSLNKFLDAMV